MSTTDTKIAQNRVYAANLGWTPTELGATSFNVLLVTLIAAQQQALGFTGNDVDGVCGPTTYRAILAHRQAAALMLFGQSTGDEKLKVAGEIAVLECKRGWLTDILDLPEPSSPDYARCQSYIDDLIRTPVGINWYWEPPYQGGYKWCGAHAGKGWRAARMRMEILQKFFSSTYRLDRYARYGAIDDTALGKNPKPKTGPYRKIVELDEKSKPTDACFAANDPLRAGDIAMIGPAQGKLAYGQHVCLVESYDVATGQITTIEGNGTGLDPHGTPQHGVVRARRLVGLQGGPPSTFHVRRILRPALSDLA